MTMQHHKGHFQCQQSLFLGNRFFIIIYIYKDNIMQLKGILIFCFYSSAGDFKLLFSPFWFFRHLYFTMQSNPREFKVITLHQLSFSLSFLSQSVTTSCTGRCNQGQNDSVFWGSTNMLIATNYLIHILSNFLSHSSNDLWYNKVYINNNH